MPATNLALSRNTQLPRHWIPVLCALAFICCTSTTLMGGHNTFVLLSAVWKFLFGNWHHEILGGINYELRKVGHFFGYGVVGLIFRNAWEKTSRTFSLVVGRWLNPFAGLLAVLSTFIVGSLDEMHQMFTPGRVGCLHDALIDTAGALFLNAIFLALWAYRTPRERPSLSPVYAS